jgi:cytochrome c oxidase cbb3-type subunit I/II
MDAQAHAEPAAGSLEPHAQRIKVVYNDAISRRFVAASVVFALVALLVGVLAAVQLAFWQANIPPWLNFGRIRPLHTNAAIFAFVGNMIFAGIYYSTQRLLRTRIASDKLASIHFWGWQAIIVAAAITLPLGLTQGKEYAELEWPIDIAIAVVWVVFAINFFWTLARRNERHLYVAIWFYIATIVTVAVLHIVNSLAIPVGPFKSYSIFGGAQDALVQWWYGHNAVAFFLTTPVLGIMYYYMPKAAGRPVYSYRLSIIHFWALIFVYIWAGPHHLLNTALPDWTQTLGMVFSVMLWAPSWGGMINGLLTLRGAWDKLRTDPVIKFFVAGVTFYGMATFEGPLLSFKSVSSLAHYTDWIIGHVHSGALGWNGFMAAGMFYWMVPRLYGTQLHSKKLANAHFYLGTLGILLYMAAMWASGITQGMMWRATTPSGGLLYPSFVETLLAIRPMYIVRMLGGLMYLTGMIIMAYNLIRTARAGRAVDGETEVVPRPAEPVVPWGKIITAPAPVMLTIVTALALTVGFLDQIGALGFICLATLVGLVGFIWIRLSTPPGQPGWHRLVEGRPLLFTVLAVIAVLIGGVAEIVPSLIINRNEAASSTTHPYRPLELQGRDIYLREGCYLCHSQMIRPMRFETLRYGERSQLADSVWDHPFQWGSKRTGPDLARIGGKYPSLWHFKHLEDPRATSVGSNMPPYAFLIANRVDFRRIPGKLWAMQRLGVPYADSEVWNAATSAEMQAAEIAGELASQGVNVPADREIVALIAYLQSLGKQAPPPDDTVPAAKPPGVAQIGAKP